MPQLKAQGEEESDHLFDQRLAVVKPLNGGRFIVEIGGNGPVLTGLARGVSHEAPSGQMVETLVTQDEGKTAPFHGDRENVGALPRKSGEGEISS
jgi:hypothetical protein